MEYIVTKNAKYALIGKIGLLVNSEIKDDLAAILPPEIIEEEIISGLERQPNNDEILDHLSSCISLVLGVCGDCNFRCKYCVYSGNYIGERMHNDKKMNFETAKKAVDLFLNLLMRDTRKKKRRDIYIGFYGGEPLLNFVLIKDVIEYVTNKTVDIGFQKRYNIIYRMTTNGYLLNDEIASYLKSKNFLMDVSMDGPEEEHDKFRVTKNGHKTWKKIMENMKKIKLCYPEYYTENISYLTTLHPLHNCDTIDRFFLDNPDLFYEKKVRINTVNTERMKKDKKDFGAQYSGGQSKLQLAQIIDDFNTKFSLKSIQKGMSLTGTCFPGGVKIFVSSAGDLNICEKASEDCPKIGHVDTGLDFDGIRKIISDYNEKIIENRCWDCELWFLCNVCMTQAYIDGRFEFNCCSIKKTHLYFIKHYLEKTEEENDKKYTSYISCSNRSITDFIDQL